MVEREVTLWDVPDVLTELCEKWTEISNLLSMSSGTGIIDSLDFVLCGDLSVPLRLQALASVFRARLYILLFLFFPFRFVICSVFN